MQSNDYGDYDDYVLGYGNEAGVEEDLLNSSETGLNLDPVSIDFDDPLIASMPKILLMGPRRGGKTSIQVRSCYNCVFLDMSMK